MKKKRIFSVMLVMLPALGLVLGGCPTGGGGDGDYTAGGGGPQAVTELNLTDYVITPALGETPAASLDGTPAQYTGSITWGPAGTTTFVDGANYTATVTLTAKSGYTFNGAPTFTHSDAQSVTSAVKAGGGVTVTIAFTQVLKPGLYIGGTLVDLSGQNGSGLVAKSLAWLGSNASSGTAYTIELSKNETLAPRTLNSSSLANNVTVTLTTANSTPRTVQLSTKGELFTVESNVTLILAGNLIINGRPDNNTYLVLVRSGRLELKESAKITGNTSDAVNHAGNGVAIHQGGTFNMSGGEISGNHSATEGGGGVFMNSWPGGSGVFNMTGGVISGNTSDGGGGVHISDSPELSDGGTNTFNMSGGTITGNTSTNSGGGVFVLKYHTGSACTFNMSGSASISNNTAQYGGGVGIWKGNFAKTGGSITGNTAASPTETVLVLNAAGDNAAAYLDADAGAGDTITVTWNGSSYTALTGLTAVP
jgi:hypothetical protein